MRTPHAALERAAGRPVRCLRPHLAAVVADVIAALPREVPSYGRPLEGAFGEGVQLGVEVALGRFLDLPGTTEPALGRQDRKVYLNLGRGEMRQGRELETLLAAYRVGARVAFRRFATLARAAELDADLLVPLAESVFAYIDELSAASAEGYAQEQSLRPARPTADARTKLALPLLAGAGSTPRRRPAAGHRAGSCPTASSWSSWHPARAEGLACAARPRGALSGAGRCRRRPRAPPPGCGVAAAARRCSPVGRGAVVGPARPGRAPHQPALARLAASRGGGGVLSDDPVWVDEHLATLVVNRDPELVGAACRRRGLARWTRSRTRPGSGWPQTLLAWLQHRGERQHVAEELHVHPQTVGYRLGQLRELFGDALEDPQARFELELALRARSAVRACPEVAGPRAAARDCSTAANADLLGASSVLRRRPGGVATRHGPLRPTAPLAS